MKCRDYQPEDKAACLEIFHSNVPDFFVPKELSDVSRLLDDRLCPYLVIADDDDKIIASGGIWIDSKEQSATLCWIMVERKLHRKGAGRLVVLKLLNLLRSFPFVNLVKLDTSQHTTAFYENFGFEKYAFIENYYTEGLHRYDMKMDWNDAKLAEVSDQLADLEATQRLQREGDV